MANRVGAAVAMLAMGTTGFAAIVLQNEQALGAHTAIVAAAAGYYFRRGTEGDRGRDK